MWEKSQKTEKTKKASTCLLEYIWFDFSIDTLNLQLMKQLQSMSHIQVFSYSPVALYPRNNNHITYES